MSHERPLQRHVNCSAPMYEQAHDMRTGTRMSDMTRASRPRSRRRGTIRVSSPSTTSPAANRALSRAAPGIVVKRWRQRLDDSPQAKRAQLSDPVLLVHDSFESLRQFPRNFATAVASFESASRGDPNGRPPPPSLASVAFQRVLDAVVSTLQRLAKQLPAGRVALEAGEVLDEYRSAAERAAATAAKARATNDLVAFVATHRSVANKHEGALADIQFEVANEVANEYAVATPDARAAMVDGLRAENQQLAALIESDLSESALFTELLNQWVALQSVPERPGAGAHLRVELDRSWDVTSVHLEAPFGFGLLTELMRQHAGTLALSELEMPILYNWRPYPSAPAVVASFWSSPFEPTYRVAGTGLVSLSPALRAEFYRGLGVFQPPTTKSP